MSLRYETTIHGLTGHEPIEIRRLDSGGAVLQIGDIRMYADGSAAIEILAFRIGAAFDEYIAKPAGVAR